MVSLMNARSVIILADATDKSHFFGQGGGRQNEFEADARTINTVLAVQSFVHDRKRFKGNIVVELLNSRYTNRLKRIGGAMLDCVTPRNIIPALMVKCSRQVGLAQLYKMLIGFEGSEFYLRSFDQITGLTFRQVRRSIRGAIVVGTKKTNSPVILNPPEGYMISRGEEIVALAEEFQDISLDEDAVRMFKTSADELNSSVRFEARQAELRSLGHSSSFKDMVIAGRPSGGKPERILLLGWRDDILDVIKLLDRRVIVGSAIVIICEMKANEQVRLLEGEGLRWGRVPPVVESTLKHATLHCYMADTTSEKDMGSLVLLHERLGSMSKTEKERRVMHPYPGSEDALEPTTKEAWKMPWWSEFDSTLIFSRDTAEGTSSSDTVTDSLTLMSMLLVRELQEDSFYRAIRHESRVQRASNTAHKAFSSKFESLQSSSFDEENEEDMAEATEETEETKRLAEDSLKGWPSTGPLSANFRRASTSNARDSNPAATMISTLNAVKGATFMSKTFGQKRAQEKHSRSGMLQGSELGPQRKDVFDNCIVMCEFLATSTDVSVRRHPYIGAGTFCEGFPTVDIVSKIMAMSAYRFDSNAVVHSLLSDGGCDICLVSAMRFCNQGDVLTIDELAERVYETNCILFAYKASFYQKFKVALNDTTKITWDYGLLAVLGPNVSGNVGDSS
jgi:hypothetical protein